MAYELAIDKRNIGIVLRIETIKKIFKKYGNDGLSRSEAIRNACEDAVKEVRLTVKEIAECESEYKENMEKRMNRRVEKKMGHVVKKIKL